MPPDITHIHLSIPQFYHVENSVYFVHVEFVQHVEHDVSEEGVVHFVGVEGVVGVVGEGVVGVVRFVGVEGQPEAGLFLFKSSSPPPLPLGRAAILPPATPYNWTTFSTVSRLTIPMVFAS